MSLITRCPACGTMFKVVSDQLKVSQGWVRCGQCASVFDASLHLQIENLQQTASGLPTEPEAGAILPDSTLGSAESTEQSPQSETPKTLEVAEVNPAEESTPELDPTNSPGAVIASVDESDEKPADVSFVRDARRQAFWRRPLVRTLFACFALLLIIFLLLQLVVQQRDKLAAFQPGLKPALQTVCEVLICSVDPLRQIDAVVIDASSFNKVNDSVYSLTFSIKNIATIAVAMPSLEVTLTDIQDQAVIRRVLTPAQFGMASGLLGPSAEFSGALTMQVTPPEASRDGGSVSRRIAGYRLLAFYP